MSTTQTLGRDAEQRAEQLLTEGGLRTVARNYRCRGGEIDLVMRDRDCLVFVEVRQRSHSDFGSSLDSVDQRKQQRLLLAARHYLAKHKWTGPCRFDVVGFDRGTHTTWVRDAFGA